MKSRRRGMTRHESSIKKIFESLDMKFISIQKNMKRIYGKSNQLFYFQVRESLSPINIPIPTPASCRRFFWKSWTQDQYLPKAMTLIFLKRRRWEMKNDSFHINKIYKSLDLNFILIKEHETSFCLFLYFRALWRYWNHQKKLKTHHRNAYLDEQGVTPIWCRGGNRYVDW